MSYHPGHQVDWIHAKKAHEPQPEITVVVTVHDDGRVELDGDDLHLSLWNHDPAWLQSVRDQAGHHGLWKPRFHALFAPRYGGRIFNLAIRLRIRQRPPRSAPLGMRGSGADTRCGWTACEQRKPETMTDDGSP